MISDKGKATPFGNNIVKLTINPKVVIKCLPENHPEIPSQLPLDDLGGVLDLKATRIVSLNLAIVAPADKKAVETKRSGMRKDVVNVIVGAKRSKIEFAAWGRLAEDMAGRTGDIRVDAVQVQPSSDNDSIELSSLDCTTIRNLTVEESATLHEEIVPASKKSFGASREEFLLAKAKVTNFETSAPYLHTEFEPETVTTHEICDRTWEIPSVMVMGFTGTDYEDFDKLAYHACEKCKFKKLGSDGKCSSCGGTAYVERFLLRCTLSDPTGGLEGVMYHEASSELNWSGNLLLLCSE